MPEPTFAQKSLFVQNSDGISAENCGLNEGVERERHAGTFFFYGRTGCRKVTAEVVQHEAFIAPGIHVTASNADFMK